MCKFYLRPEDLMTFYGYDSKSSAYRQKRAIKDALEQSNKKRLTVEELCKHENITLERLTAYFNQN